LEEVFPNVLSRHDLVNIVARNGASLRTEFRDRC